MPLAVPAPSTAPPAVATGPAPARSPQGGDGVFADVLADQVGDQAGGPGAGGTAAAANPSADASAPDDAQPGPADDDRVALDAAAIALVAALPAQQALPAAARPATATATATATAEPVEGVARGSSRVRHGWSLAPTTAGTAIASTPAAPTPATTPVPAAPTGPTVAGAPVAGPAAMSAGATPPTPPTPSAPDGSGAPVAAGREAATATSPQQVDAPLPLLRGTARPSTGLAGISTNAANAIDTCDAAAASITSDSSIVPSGVALTDGAASATAPGTHPPHPSAEHPAGAPLLLDATASPLAPGPGASGAVASTATGAVAPEQVARTEQRPAELDAAVIGTAPSGVLSPPLQAVSAPTTAAPVAPPNDPPPLTEQLVPRLVKLPGLGEGVHRLTLDVRPEAIGSVTVVAHIRPDSVRIELVGATAGAHEALRGVLDDLRRDLAATGSQASLDLGTGTGTGTGTRGERVGTAGGPWLRTPGAAAGSAPAQGAATPRLKAAAGRVDVLA